MRPCWLTVTAYTACWFSPVPVIILNLYLSILTLWP